ncbi:hypothetical protein MFFC18_32440 [Mariniblastus fucicola]|uniref:Secreted protein n=1 Tax=Mariniblastus fucicola TaxID=980251 RepID=A0A5B9PFD3_9BACT|nr:hypothetical protein MFFC18_32440 [Mariniblastus fucicola]
MFRLLVCLILVPALLANQAVICCAHSHDGHVDSAPHYHLSWEVQRACSHDHSHFHKHDSDNGSHSHPRHRNQNEDHHGVRKACDSELCESHVDCEFGLGEHDEGLLISNDESLPPLTSRLLFCGQRFTSEPCEILCSFRPPLSAQVIDPIDALLGRYPCALFLQTGSLRL